MTPFVFLYQTGESPGARFARCAEQAGLPGAMGYRVDQERYQGFLEVRGRAKQLCQVKTSCAVVASAVMGWCGYPMRKPWKADGTWGITSWLGLTLPLRNGREWLGGSPSWCWAEDGVPELGDIFYRDYARSTTNSGHVGVLVRKHDDGLWTTFEGGQWLDPKKDADIVARFAAKDLRRINGTICRLSREPKDIRAFDKMNRKLIGWWRAEKLELGGMPPTYSGDAA